MNSRGRCRWLGISAVLLGPAACGLQPVLDAGTDATVFENQKVMLVASNVSAAEFTSFFWEQIEGPRVALENADAQQASFTAPWVDETTVLMFQVTGFSTVGSVTVPVLQGNVEVGGELPVLATDTIMVTVMPNPVPQVEAGADRVVNPGQSVSLAGEAFIDAAGMPLRYRWSQTGGTPVVLSTPNQSTATFAAPEQTGALVFELTVEADPGNSAADTVTVTVIDTPLGAPMAAGGADQIVEEGSQVTLDAGASSDPAGGALTYLWTQLEGEPVNLNFNDSQQVVFTAVTVGDGASLLRFRVTVTSVVSGLSAEDEVNVVVLESTPQSPTALVSGPDSVYEGESITWSGVGSSDPKGRALTYFWEILHDEGLSLVLDDPTAPIVTVTAPAVTEPAAIIVRLTVTNSIDRSAAVTFATTVLPNPSPTANAGPDQFVNEGTAVTLDGTASADPAGGQLTYLWTVPSGISSISSTTTVKPVFTAPTVTASRVYTFTLTVTEPDGRSATDSVDITVLDVN